MYSAATDELIREHREVEQLLDRLEALLLEPASNKQEIDKTFLLVRRDLALHLRKEEEAYFPALEAYLPANSGPLAVMLMDHNELRKLEEEFPQHAGEFIEVLRAHIQKEDHVLFPFAEQRFTPEQRDAVLAGMQKIAGTVAVAG